METKVKVKTKEASSNIINVPEQPKKGEGVLSFNDLYLYIQERTSHFLLGVTKPKKELLGYISKLENADKLAFNVLEEYMSVFSSWQSYYEEQIVILEGVKNEAQIQAETFHSKAVKKATGLINTRKEYAKSDPEYIAALSALVTAKSILESFRAGHNACNRGYQTISRIVSVRLGSSI